ncbi:hypothetical protein FQA39_LY04717 [Lamprigera yunnana]|nr:hypothetical protein FQA39_LY04717 [Lamprigera yunnana]
MRHRDLLFYTVIFGATPYPSFTPISTVITDDVIAAILRPQHYGTVFIGNQSLKPFSARYLQYEWTSKIHKVGKNEKRNPCNKYDHNDSSVETNESSDVVNIDVSENSQVVEVSNVAVEADTVDQDVTQSRNIIVYFFCEKSRKKIKGREDKLSLFTPVGHLTLSHDKKPRLQYDQQTREPIGRVRMFLQYSL